jgi:hypothetical protein
MPALSPNMTTKSVFRPCYISSGVGQGDNFIFSWEPLSWRISRATSQRGSQMMKETWDFVSRGKGAPERAEAMWSDFIQQLFDKFLLHARHCHKGKWDLTHSNFTLLQGLISSCNRHWEANSMMSESSEGGNDKVTFRPDGLGRLLWGETNLT